MGEKDLLRNPPQKVLLMYQAVIDMVKEGFDINKMKVSDITTRAGIGKGTAYEYFSTKEELITKALAYDVEQKLEEVTEIAMGTQDFETKIKGVLDFLGKRFGEIQTFCTLVRIGTNSFEVSENFKEEYVKIQSDINCSRAEAVIDEIMKQGQEEGIISQKSLAQNRMAFSAQMIAYASYLISQKNGIYEGVTMEEARQFVYESLVKSLN